ncbi:ECF-type sigma factor [Luteolibacter sp. LG18]|uniref:ECF-type sigma factor n=1 Tax=Luteolibacter sp. LG18 TaxID=2819286 RepID=UPI002B2E2D94|nr:extracytoplasmic sigma factor ECF [Luteolibacter sp. LG18]
MNDIREILEKATANDQQVAAELLPLLYDELRMLAGGYLSREAPGQTLQPTALVHEAWLRLGKDSDRSWGDRAQFFRAAAKAMRLILVDRARAKLAQKRGEKPKMVALHHLDLAEAPMSERVLLVDEMLTRLEEEDPESARLISLKFFGGLTNQEIARMHGVTERTIERQWAYAKARLFDMITEETEGEIPGD